MWFQQHKINYILTEVFCVVSKAQSLQQIFLLESERHEKQHDSLTQEVLRFQDIFVVFSALNNMNLIQICVVSLCSFVCC